MQFSAAFFICQVASRYRVRGGELESLVFQNRIDFLEPSGADLFFLSRL
jgi:hypothetical protein